jgi:hypothetical protein
MYYTDAVLKVSIQDNIINISKSNLPNGSVEIKRLSLSETFYLYRIEQLV